MKTVILLLDQGNSRIKWLSVRADGTLVGMGAEENNAPISHLIDQIGRDRVSCLREIHVCNVAGADRGDLLCEVFVGATGVLPHFIVHPEDCAELTLSGYKDSSTLGVDRWLCMIAARQSLTGPLLVVSAGTAVTIDGVDRNGRHLGGYILPGLRAQFQSLTNAARLKAAGACDDLEATDSWGFSTESAIQLGVLRGVTGAVEWGAAQLDSSGESRATVVLTGGDATTIQPWVRRPVLVVRDLLFRGMWARVTSSRGRLSK